MDWADIAKTIATNAIFMAILGFVAKSIFDQLLSRDIENHKAKLQATHDIELEKIKSDLSRVTLEHQIIFSKLHETRAEVVAKLYELLVDAEDFYQSVALGLYTAVPFDENEKKIQIAVNKWHELKVYFSHNRIYFDDFLCEKMDNLIGVFGTSAAQYVFLNDGETIDMKAVKVFSDLISEEIPEIKQLIEGDFRELLGIDSRINDIPF